MYNLIPLSASGQHAVESQLEALTSMDLSPPAPDDDEDVHQFIREKLKVASNRDNARFGYAREPTATLEDALPVFERFSRRCVISANNLTCSKLKFNTLSIDAVDPLRLHSVDNIQFVCLRLNYGKSTLNDAAYKEWAKNAFIWQGAPSDTSDVAFNHSARMNRLHPIDDADYDDEDL